MNEIDWSKPLETAEPVPRAVSPDTLALDRGSSVHYAGVVEGMSRPIGWTCFGYPASGYYGPRIRNVRDAVGSTDAPPSPDPKLYQEMVELVERMADYDGGHGYSSCLAAHEQAKALAKRLKPEDPDLQLARDCVIRVYEQAGRKDLANECNAGKMDNRLRVQSALAAIKLGRTLASQERQA